jgi:hypothetical protein
MNKERTPLPVRSAANVQKAKNALEMKSAPLLASGAASLNNECANAHIWVREPWPLGVLMESQVPLATYFHWCGS